MEDMSTYPFHTISSCFPIGICQHPQDMVTTSMCRPEWPKSGKVCHRGKVTWETFHELVLDQLPIARGFLRISGNKVGDE